VTAPAAIGCDVAIVGAGPAGSALAIHLAGLGRPVVLLEAGSFDGPRIGESLAPAVQPLLRDLGVWADVVASDPVPSWGTRSLWNDHGPMEHSHLVAPYQQGWHVDRRAFDELLARAAEARGALLRCGARVRRAAHGDGGWWIDADGCAPVRSRVLIDASGRNGRLARSLRTRRMVFDHLVGVGRRWSGGSAGEHHVLIEAVPDGWWYSAPLPGGGLITLLMTDADICREGRLVDDRVWEERLCRTRLTLDRVGSARDAGPVRSHAANSSRLLRDDRLPWLAVGDAALAVDPLTGSGVTRALRTAAGAAATVVDVLDGDAERGADAIERYEHDRNVECHQYLHERLDFYAAGPDLASPFWLRRRAVVDRRAACSS
jgi:flavin-dependent dehydrogenase